jgi:hypothetical protein
VEFEPTKMVVVQDFSPCVEDELQVKRGQIVKALYQENEWRFVIAEDGREGFIPYTFCIPTDEANMKPKKHDERYFSQPQYVQQNDIGNYDSPIYAYITYASTQQGVILSSSIFIW